MPRTPAPIPPITAIPRDLTVDDVADIIQTAERAQARRSEWTAQMRAALQSGDQARVTELAKALVGLEREAIEQ